MKNMQTKKLTMCAMIAAIYVALGLVFAPINFGLVQFRVSEALTLLPVFSPWAIVGVTAGCLATNFIGVAMGATAPLDVVFGTAATLLAAVLTYLLRGIRVKNLPVLAALPPILINGLVVGWELTFFFLPQTPYWAAVLSVSLGEAAVCLVLGLLLVYALQKTKLDTKLFS